MKKLLTAIVLILIATNVVLADTRVAVVDVNALVSNSSQVKALKNEQTIKTRINEVNVDTKTDNGILTL